MAAGKKRGLHLSKLYSFRCGRALVKDDGLGSRIGGPGFSRVVYCNESNNQESILRSYASNYVRTTKYTAVTFFPKSLFEQFRRVANFYFLVAGILSFTPLAPYSATSAIIPLTIVIGFSMLKEAIEDWRRKQQDIEVNNRKVMIHGGGGFVEGVAWKDLKVGDIVKVEKDEFFPADMVLLSSSYEDGVCYVETMNLDGETNLKLKQALEATSSKTKNGNFIDFRAVVKCEDPNANLYSFVGSMEHGEQKHPLSPQQLLLRDSKLRNTEYIYGAVIFTGHDTKVMQNATAPPSKRSNIEKKMDRIIYMLFGLLFLIAFGGSVYFGIVTRQDLDRGNQRWYLHPDNSTIFFDPHRAPVAAIYHFLTALLLYGSVIPISLYVSIEIVKVLQTIFINQDVHMYYEETDKPTRARTSNLMEELGQVDTILSDKTGTLTCNSMEFIKCSIAGTAYGRGVTEVERAMAKRDGTSTIAMDSQKKSVKGYNFDDERIVDGNWVKEKHSHTIQKFFQLLAICHTAIPDVDEKTENITYEAESPDEAAFVIAARELGFEFFKRTQTSVSVHELDPVSGKRVKRVYSLLNVLEFNSARKRMSVIVRDGDGKFLLLCKGADSVMFERLVKNREKFEAATKQHVDEYADAGLRTLILAYRELNEEEYNAFNEKFSSAKNSLSVDRVEEAMEQIEKDLILLGATAVEDKLQEGVPECIDKLAQAGIKIWVLTGDKMETAINIGYACSLLRHGMTQIVITLDQPEIIALEKEGDKLAISQASKRSVIQQINHGKADVSKYSSDAFALIIDGKSLAYALEDEVKNMFLGLAIGCASVICCRSSPKQKALVTRLVKEGTKKTILGIGDGANDVGMLQEADIGIGISGVEGMQAVMSSDVAIAQFRFLERLLLVHGHWCYRRISSMICYFFYKNLAYGFTIFFYEAFTTFSGQPAYNDWYLSLYNVFFTSMPVIALGVFDQDVSARYCLKFPLLYQEGIQNVLFSWRRIIGWMINGIITAIIIFYFSTIALTPQAFNADGKPADYQILGATMYTSVVWVANCQMALAITYFTLIQHIFTWGGIVAWYLFLLAYGSLSPDITTTAYQVFVETLAPTPAFYVVTFLVTISALVPYVVYDCIQTWFFPMYHTVLQRMTHDGRAEDPEFYMKERQKSVAHKHVGLTARSMARDTSQSRY